MRRLIWRGRTLRTIQGYPEAAQGRIGHDLHRVQTGEMPADFKSMPSVGHGVYEIRVHLKDEYRVLYIANILDLVVALHCFIKKSQQTPDREIKAARKQLKQVLEELSHGQISSEE